MRNLPAHRILQVTVSLFVAFMMLNGQPAFAQNRGVPEFDQQILDSLATLQAAVDALGNVTETNIRATPPTDSREGFIGCQTSNISTAPRTVHIQLIGGAGQIISESTPTLAAGAISNTTRVGGGVYAGLMYCKFTVTDGTKADIRASLTREVGASFTSVLVVPAE